MRRIIQVTALAMMLGDAQAQRLIRDRHTKRVRVHGTFVITDYEMSVECDAPWARARAASSATPRVCREGEVSLME